MVDTDNTAGTQEELDEDDDQFVALLTDKILLVMEVLVGYPLRPYQIPLARRIIESVLIEDAATITALAARQSGKSETLCNTVAVLLVLLPLLARIFPNRLAKFKDGLWVGVFAPVADQAETLYGRIVDRLTSERAVEFLNDPSIDDAVVAKSHLIRFKRNGSRMRMMTANPRAKIESQSFHLVLVDEAQDCNDFVIRKSIEPMVAAYAGTVVKTGTPTTRKGDFFAEIRNNKRKALAGGRKDHFEWDWREVAKVSPQYRKTIEKTIERIGEDSDEFQMSFCLRWLLEQGMFTTETRLEELGDTSVQELIKVWTRTPVVVGIDVARMGGDSTVVTVAFVDWDRPDEYGMYAHRVLNWLELQGMPLEQQYYYIVNFLENYNLFAVAVDAQGMGAAVAERLAVLLRHKNCEVIGMSSNAADQNERWKHLTTLMDRGLVGWPAGAKVRRLRVFKRFWQQMVDAEKHYQGPYLVVKAPDENNAHDDFVDSLALATYTTKDLSAPQAEMSTAPWFR